MYQRDLRIFGSPVPSMHHDPRDPENVNRFLFSKVRPCQKKIESATHFLISVHTIPLQIASLVELIKPFKEATFVVSK